jgi:hypothetical protein
LSFLIMIQANANFHAIENFEKKARRRTGPRSGAIMNFDAHNSDHRYPNTYYDSLELIGTINMLIVTTRFTCERRDIQFGVLYMVNATCILVFS